MDPNTALENLRDAFNEMLEANAQQDSDGFYIAAHDAFEAWSALDDWMSTGGFLPEDWEDARKRPAGARKLHLRRR